MNHLTAQWARLAAVQQGPSPLPGYKWRAERLAIIEGSGYHPEGDLDAAKAKQKEKAKRGSGLARQLVTALYERYPEAKVHWGKMMQAEIGRLYESFQQSHPEQTGNATRYF